MRLTFSTQFFLHLKLGNWWLYSFSNKNFIQWKI